MGERIIVGGDQVQRTNTLKHLDDQTEAESRLSQIEREKTPEEKRCIEVAIKWLEEECLEMGLSIDHISLDQIHFLSEEEWLLKHGSFRDHGITNNNTFNIDIQQEVFDSANLPRKILLIVHEMTHATGHHKYFPKNTFQSDEVLPYRIGYRTVQKDRMNARDFENVGRLSGFNEAMVDLFSWSVIDRHRTELSEMLGEEVSVDTTWDAITYWDYVSVVNQIISGITETRNKELADVYQTMFKGLFTGEMMHLREVNRVWGENGLKILAIMGEAAEKKVGIEKIHQFFSTTVPAEFEPLGQEILALVNG